MQHVEHPRILSFGCSTGEELVTLSRYFPSAEIVGVDVNAWCLRQCARRSYAGNVRLVHRFSPEFKSLGTMDAIFCMAVLQRSEHRNGGTPAISGFTFSSFEREVSMLDSMLKVSGLIFLDESDFAFEMTNTAARYRALEFESNRVFRNRPLFDRDNQIIAKTAIVTRAFQKLAD